jgi:hypothetical protein
MIAKTTRCTAILAAFLSFFISRVYASEPRDEKAESPKATVVTQERDPSSRDEDPFAELEESASRKEVAAVPERSWAERFVSENFGFRKEVMSQFATTVRGRNASRQSAGFELLKKFSTQTATVASFNFQGRLVRRDGFIPVSNDMEGSARPGWAFEYHNFYVDFYNILNPVFSEEQRGRNIGKFNFRAGRFYVPFGLNLQTDTHGTVLQLSNDRNFGFERDWYTGLWGSVNKHLNYDAYYLAGSGYDLKFKGQAGLGALRLSLANKYSSEFGLEGGVSVIAGERLASQSMADAHDSRSDPISTQRVGADVRYRRSVPNGLITLTNEVSTGRDAHVNVSSQLYQAEYLHSSRKWGMATQYRQFGQAGAGSDSSIIAELTWYLRNDVGNSSLHWIKLNVERQLTRMQGPPSTVVALQYYFYR